mgnify:CR=1 FL=1
MGFPIFFSIFMGVLDDCIFLMVLQQDLLKHHRYKKSGIRGKHNPKNALRHSNRGCSLSGYKQEQLDANVLVHPDKRQFFSIHTD